MSSPREQLNDEILILRAERDDAESEARALKLRLNELYKALQWLIESIPEYEGDDNLTEPMQNAKRLLIQQFTKREQP